jgi:hypothetical protein
LTGQMSVDGPTQAIFAAPPLVSYWHKADIRGSAFNVRFRGQSGHASNAPQCPLMTQVGSRAGPNAKMHNGSLST